MATPRKKPEERKKLGRPTIRTKEMEDEILERLSNGEPLTKICRDEHMPNFSTIFRWELADPEFCKLTSRAREIGTHALVNESIEISDDPLARADQKRVRIETRLRVAGMFNRRLFGDSKEVRLADANGDPIQNLLNQVQEQGRPKPQGAED